MAVLGCSRTKLPHPAPARELYQGHLFRLAWAYAEARAERVRILSALHGVVRPDWTVRPYERRLTELPPAARTVWGDEVAWALREELWASARPRVLVLAPHGYWRHVTLPAHVAVEQPLRGLSIGEQKRWLLQRLAEAHT
jgi:cytoplasmic iron level regulating protein YaaA (DUF328/UPF0246 family)